uniref:Uncharacterized protein n=1 Tax=Rhizophora mucronata TaxID=61149 RepID=A0A2P2MYL6_RHIMU
MNLTFERSPLMKFLEYLKNREISLPYHFSYTVIFFYLFPFFILSLRWLFQVLLSYSCISVPFLFFL